MDKFMQMAIDEAYSGINNNEGGPFGSIIVKDGKVIGRGHNRVIKNQDPTCHGEMEAIRDASKNLKSFDLKGSILYTTAEPCPMCLGAILWANIDTVYYGCNIYDTEEIGFRDSKFYSLKEEDKKKFIKELDRPNCKELFHSYMKIKDKTTY